MKPDDDRLERDLEAVRRTLRGHRSDAQPDEGFAARVVASLPERRPSEALGWVALKLLPAALAIGAALVWVSLDTAPVATDESPVPSEDVLAWVLDDGGLQ